ncbi:MAG: hypothetical protein IKJ05_02480 [Oscillospiraceae bacterium]|nr:hypothetical protein [Oscillospiraceae bacterium]
MFALVALMALYLGVRNIKNAFIIAPFGQWQFINWSLFMVGILMVLAGIACVWQANKDYQAKQAEKEEKEKLESEKRKQQFYYDDNSNQ